MSVTPASTTPVLDASAFARAKAVFGAPAPRMPAGAVQALASEVITRLSHRHAVPHEVSAAPEVPMDAALLAQVERLAEALLDPEDAAASGVVAEAQAAGVEPEAIYLGLIAEAARTLGRWWDEDRISSVDVVLGAGRIYAIMRGLRRLYFRQAPLGTRFRALFGTAPGETHSLGVAVAADVLSRRGWEIDLRPGLAHDDLLAEVRRGNHAIVGLSAGTPRMLFPLARVIVGLRLVHPGVWVLVSGRLVEIEPEVARLVDADAAAAGLNEAEALMTAHVEEVKAAARA